MNKFPSFLIGVLAAILAVAVAAPANAQVTGWTTINPDYGTSTDTPVLSGCTVSRTTTKTTIKVKAKRPTQVASAVTTVWNAKSDFSGAGGSVTASQWSANVTTMKVTMTNDSFTVISWQNWKTGTGTAITQPRRLLLVSCS